MANRVYNTGTIMPKAIGYRRLSKERGESGLSLTAQRKAIEDQAKRLELPLAATFTDSGISGGAPVLFQISAQSQLQHLQRDCTVCELRLIGRVRGFWHGRVVGSSPFLPDRLTGLLCSPRR